MLVHARPRIDDGDAGGYPCCMLYAAARWFAPAVLFVSLSVGPARGEEIRAAGNPAPPDVTVSPSRLEAAPRAADMASDAEKPERAQESVARMREILARMLKYLEEARAEKDIVKLNCVNEKLTAVKGLLRISEQADVSMQEALARRDVEVSAHEYEKVSIARHKSEQLLAESEACVGELAVFSGETQVEVIIDNAPKSDVVNETGGVILDFSRPPVASPYQ